LRARFVPDRPGPLVGLHAIHSGRGACWVDRWPGARGGLVFTGGNLTFWGDPDALPGGALRDIVRSLLDEWDRVLIEVPLAFETLVRRALPDLLIWPREIFIHTRPPTLCTAQGAEVRRLTRCDAEAVRTLDEGIQWISDTYGGPAELAQTATAWGAYVAGQLVSVAVPYFVGDRHEDIGVVTAEAFRGRGLSPACAAHVMGDIRARGRIPCWSTARDNTPSRRVAEKLGFVKHRSDALYIAGMPMPGAVAPPPGPEARAK
jgi:GNAT superfamily N-acetyltransferase